MADKQENQPEQQPELTPEQAEEKFWGKHKEVTTGILDEWFEKKREEFRGRSTSRAGGRATIPSIFADILFGPAKEK